MGKPCCAVGCTNWFLNGSSISFCRFLTEPERRERWIATVNRKDWAPANYTWICSQHFVSGSKSDDPLSSNYVPLIFFICHVPCQEEGCWWHEALRKKETAMKQKWPLAADQGTSQTLTFELQHLDHPGSHSDNEEHSDSTPSLDLALAESDEPEHS